MFGYFCLALTAGINTEGPRFNASDPTLRIIFFKEWAKPGLFLVYFRSFSQHKDKYSTNFTINDKSIDGAWESNPGGMMEAQTNPLSYVGTP